MSSTTTHSLPTDVPVARTDHYDASFSTGAIIGVTITAFLLAFLAFVLGVCLFIRWRRNNRQPKFKRVPDDREHAAQQYWDGTEKPRKVQRPKGRDKHKSILSEADRGGEPIPFLVYGDLPGSRSATPVPALPPLPPTAAAVSSHIHQHSFSRTHSPRPSFSSVNSYQPTPPRHQVTAPTPYTVLASGPPMMTGKSRHGFGAGSTSSLGFYAQSGSGQVSRSGTPTPGGWRDEPPAY